MRFPRAELSRSGDHAIVGFFPSMPLFLHFLSSK
jgi:hypothetical protein